MKLHKVKITTKREDIKMAEPPFEIQRTNESIEISEEKLLMSILDRILKGEVINAKDN